MECKPVSQRKLEYGVEVLERPLDLYTVNASDFWPPDTVVVMHQPESVKKTDGSWDVTYRMTAYPSPYFTFDSATPL